MSDPAAPRPSPDRIERLFSELQDHLVAVGDAPEGSAAEGLEALARLQKIVGLMRRTAVHSFGQFEQRVSELSLLRNFGALLDSISDRERMLRPLAVLIEDTIPCSAAVVCTIDPASGTRDSACTFGSGRIAIPDDELERVLLEVAGEQASSWLEPTGEVEARAFFCPAISRSETLGVIGVFEGEPGSLGEGTVRAIADFTGIALRQVCLWDRVREHQVHLEELVEERTRQINDARIALNRQERIAAMGKLAASIAHEVNNPMSFVISNLGRAAEFAEALEACLPEVAGAISAAVDLPAGTDPRLLRARAAARRVQELLRENGLGGDSPAELREIIQESRDGADRLRHVGDQLRSFAQGAVGEMERVDVNALMETAAQVCRAEAGGRAALECRPGDVPRLLCNRYQVLHAVVNLIQNAIEATGSGGKVIVGARALDGSVELSVTDEGPGVEPRELDRIFEPFYTTKAQGTGLGLSVARDIARSHGGVLEASSGPGGGVFRLRIPIDERRRSGASPGR